MRRSWFVCLAGTALVLAACADSADTTPSISFCQRASDYLQFEGGLANSAGSPAQTEAFVTAWVVRLDTLQREAQGSGLPDSLASDIDQIRVGVAALDQRLAAVDYDLFDLVLADLDLPPESDAASGRLSTFIGSECSDELGTTTAPTGPAPLSEEELAELLGESDPSDDELRTLVEEELQSILGLQPAEAACLVEEASTDDLAGLLVGQPLSPDAIERLAAAVEFCDIPIERLAGQ